jgi:pimeloyl-ACP methyl ester carboxylesterase
MAGTAVLVHGSWGNPDDWFLVDDLLCRRGVSAVAVDLPSSRPGGAELAEDVTAVLDAVDSVEPPIVLVGWSYGCKVITESPVDPGRVVGLVFVACLPAVRPESADQPPEGPPIDMSVLEFPDDQTVALADERWLGEVVPTFPAAVRSRIRARRPTSIAPLIADVSFESWRTVPSTVVLGRQDEGSPEAGQRWATDRFDDVRIVDGDHFLPFRDPEVIADAVVHRLTADRGTNAE